jgi:probable O-glycosylation ligase (exosortase A-associated)
MRDVVVMSMVLVLAVCALRRPWVGVLLWLWVSLMNPHRYTYGFAYDAPVAMIAALSTLIGLVFAKDRESPFKAPAVTLFLIFTAWVTLSWQAGFDPSGQYSQWDKIMKINFMVIICLVLFRTKEQIFVLAWVLTLSIALLSAKGGVFTVAHGGSYRVWGPPGSWIEGSNEFAVATIMVIPLLRFLQLQVTSKWIGRVLMAGMLLCAASALGSQSRGALLAIIAMTTVLWWRGQNRVSNGVLFLVIGLAGVSAMPENWTQRMDTIETYDEDASAMGRISAWWVSFNLAKSHFFGVGFSIASPDIFMAHSPYGMQFGTPVAHSIWFQVMGHHGFIGLLIFVAIWVSAWFTAQGLRSHARRNPSIKWVGDLGAMSQVSLVGFLAGGTFLQLAYYDFPYYVMAMVAITAAWVRRQGWTSEPQTAKGWRAVIGLAPRPQVTAGAPVRAPGTPTPRPGPKGMVR